MGEKKKKHKKKRSETSDSDSEEEDRKKRKHKKHKKHKKKRKHDSSDSESEPTQKRIKLEHENIEDSRSPKEIITELLQMYPEDGKDDLKFLFQAFDDGKSIIIDDLEDENVKRLLKILFKKLNLDLYDTGYEKPADLQEPLFNMISEMIEGEKIQETKTVDEVYGPTLEPKRRGIIGPYIPTKEDFMEKMDSKKIAEDERRKLRDEETKKMIEEYNKQHRPEPLIKSHRKIIKKERPKEKFPAKYLTFDRERDLETNYYGPERVKKMMQEAKLLDSKFEKRFQTSSL